MTDSHPKQQVQNRAILQDALLSLNNAIRLLAWDGRMAWADEVARIRNDVEKELRR